MFFLWGCFGDVLGMFWECFGDVLGMLWGCFSDVLGICSSYFHHIFQCSRFHIFISYFISCFVYFFMSDRAHGAI